MVLGRVKICYDKYFIDSGIDHGRTGYARGIDVATRQRVSRYRRAQILPPDNSPGEFV